MRNYNKLSKKELVALLETIEGQLDGCIERAEQKAEERARDKQEVGIKYACMVGILESEIGWMVKTLGQEA